MSDKEPTANIQKFMDSMVDSCRPQGRPRTRDEIPLGSCSVGWSAKGIGFGSFYFFEKKDDDGEIRLYCDNECMSREFIKKMLCVMVDEAIMLDENRKDKKDDKS